MCNITLWQKLNTLTCFPTIRSFGSIVTLVFGAVIEFSGAFRILTLLQVLLCFHSMVSTIENK